MDPVLGTLLAGIVAAVGAYIAAARRFSGKIETSDAAELWAESRAIRDWSQNRIREQGEQIDTLTERVRELEESNRSLALKLQAAYAQLQEAKT